MGLHTFIGHYLFNGILVSNMQLVLLFQLICNRVTYQLEQRYI